MAKAKKIKKELAIGNEVVVKAALAAGATAFFGYPITPATEIIALWPKFQPKHKTKFLQTEDEPSAGFTLIGAVLAGEKSFTATAGPGTVLMQDAFSMAEAMRIPTVAVIVQRGGPSTGTVIYSQQEVLLTCFGGNGEGFRVVYSPATLQELYDVTIQSFNTAWQYRFPTFVLTDGYLGKMRGLVDFYDPAKKRMKMVKSEPILLNPKKKKGEYVNMKNCVNLEEEIFQINENIRKDFDRARPKIEKWQNYQDKDAEFLIIAHGIVGAAAQVAVDRLREQGIKAGMFRPITLQPFPEKEARKIAKAAKKIFVLESSCGQFIKIVKEALYGLTVPIKHFARPALGITPEEIVSLISEK
ncbi:ferredoxin oxidoreductase [Patescibacteria group bacterium]|nr:ferredoxin oxidoreductase [Patescibacteria group bacterium]